MATGLEVLGAVSAVCALVSFARETISVCKRVYNGESTADEDLKKHAEQMSEAIAWVQTRCMGIGSAHAASHPITIRSLKILSRVVEPRLLNGKPNLDW
jgi:uncharacterized membrane protein